MNSIRFIKEFFWNEELCAHGRGKGHTELFLRQGDLDGACAVYSLMMMLLKKITASRGVSQGAYGRSQGYAGSFPWCSQQ